MKDSHDNSNVPDADGFVSITSKVSLLLAASMGVIHSRRQALVVSVDADPEIRDRVIEALNCAHHSPDNVHGLADYTTFPTSGLYIWTGVVISAGRCQVSNVPWFDWIGDWRVLVPAEVAAVAMSEIVQRGEAMGQIGGPVPVRQVAAALWGVSRVQGTAVEVHEDRRVAS
jgi:hypothetical protein